MAASPRLPAALLAALVVLLAGCGRTDRPVDGGDAGSAPLLGPRSALARSCPAPDPATGATQRAAQARAGQRIGLDVGLRFETATPREAGACQVATLAQRLGVSSLREDLDWESIEPREGAYDWRATDRLVTAAARRGLGVLPVITGQPSWARGDAADAAFGRLAGEAFRRYGPGGPFAGAPAGPPVEVIELGNEPYVSVNPEAMTPAAYARRVRVAVAAARAIAPRARFLLEADTRYTPLDGGPVRPSYLEDVLDAEPGLGASFDGVAVHPYGATPAPFDAADTATNQPGRVEQLRAELVARGLADKPLWVTEIGWSTCTDRSVCVSQAEQADDLRRFLQLARTRWRSYVRAVYVYQLRDSGSAGDDPADIYGAFGLLGRDFRAKPALGALRAATGAP